MQMPINNKDMLGDLNRPTKWLEKIFLTEEEMFTGLAYAVENVHVYQHDYKTINGPHGVEYMLMIEVHNDTENPPGFTADAFEASYDDYSVGYEDA